MVSSLTTTGKLKGKQITHFEWKIENFSFYNDKKIGDFVRSSIFDQSWYVRLYPKGNSVEQSKDHISIYLYNTRDIEVKVSHSCYLINNVGKKIKLYTGTCTTYKKKGDREDNWGSPNAIKISDLMAKSFIVNDTLTLLFEISTIDDFVLLNYGSEELCAFEKLINNERFSDVTIKVGRKNIMAHKIILSSQSTVFDAMLAHGIKENQKNVLVIKGIKYEVFMELLRFIYAGKVNKIENIAQELFVAANRYAIYGLKEKCESVLVSTIDNNKVFEYLKIADACSASSLKNRLIEYIKKNVKDIVHTATYKQFATAHPDIALEITRGIAALLP